MGWNKKLNFIGFRMSSESNGVSAGDLKIKAVKIDAFMLPSELLFNIMSFVQLQETPWCPHKNLHNCCLVSRSWYSVAVVTLYQSPVLEGEKHLLFFRTICLSKKAHYFKSPLSQYVKRLDLRAWPHHVRESDTEELLARVAGGLEAFVAPDTSFS
jgi:hypothetical protein